MTTTLPVVPTAMSARGRVIALLEVTLAFVVMHVAFRAFKRFTTLGQLEYEHDVNFSPGLVMIAIAYIAIWARRRTLAAHGITGRGLSEHANVAFVSILVYSAVALLAIAFGMRRDASWSDPRIGFFACVLSLFVSFLILYVLARSTGLLARLPRWTGAVFACALPLIPIAVRLVEDKSVAHTVGAVLSIVLGAALAESVFFHGYVQSRLNEAFGRPWRIQGVAFGPALFMTAGLFGLVHLLNTYDYFSGGGRLAWWWGATGACSLFFGFLREKTGNIVATTILHAFIDLASRGPGLLTEP